MALNQHQHSYYPADGAAPGSAATQDVAERAKFIERTYLHLAGAIAGFVGLEYLFFSTSLARTIVLGLGQLSPLLFILLFVGASWGADWAARRSTSRPVQYLALAGYVAIQAVFMTRLLAYAQYYGGPDVIMTAGVSTMAIFAALTGIVMITKRDFSWMRGALAIVTLAAVGLIVASLLLGFQLGILFTVAMIALAACYILYDTSNVMRYYHPQAYVSAALTLFASVILMFVYVLRLLTSFSRD